MSALNLFYSFRIRLLLVLAALLVATLGLQYYLNRRAERKQAELNERARQETDRVIAEQEQALSAATALGIKSISQREWLYNLYEHAKAKQPLLDEKAGRITNILVVASDGRVLDSLKDYNPIQKPDGTLEYFYLHEVKLPPLITPVELEGDTTAQLPQSSTAPAPQGAGEPRAFVLPVETDKRGRNYIIVALGSANAPSGMVNREEASSVLYTLAVFLLMAFLTTLLVWRFTRPIKDLSEAARRVAAGELDFRVPAERRDEMGALGARFNEMIAGLGRTRELESRLNQAERSAVVGRLASAIAHEIRNPLNYINLTLDHLRTAFAPEDLSKRETFERLAVQLKKEVARINTRITEFLKYSRPTRLELQPLNLKSLSEDALRMVEVQAVECGIETRVEAEGDVPAIMGDEDSLRSVFTNLIINGLQAIDGGGGSLTIHLARENGNARIEFTDTGRGISPENIPQIFEPYFSTKETGTGLGLAIVKKAVDDHGGTISVRSSPGAGTTFTITLPVKPAAR
ncbi:MAG: HAMP domain-containing protein [Pyrinomonadaceae bacterium]|nr:HAMP domain-containing protein [Pyrinomonadaceae bacterium]